MKIKDNHLVEYQAECNDCDWKGNADEMDWSEEDDEILVCPECGSESIYYFE